MLQNLKLNFFPLQFDDDGLISRDGDVFPPDSLLSAWFTVRNSGRILQLKYSSKILNDKSFVILKDAGSIIIHHQLFNKKSHQQNANKGVEWGETLFPVLCMKWKYSTSTSNAWVNVPKVTSHCRMFRGANKMQCVVVAWRCRYTPGLFSKDDSV